MKGEVDYQRTIANGDAGRQMKKTRPPEPSRQAIFKGMCSGLGICGSLTTATLRPGERKNPTLGSIIPRVEATYRLTEQVRDERRGRAYGTTARMCWRLLVPCSWERRGEEVKPLSCISCSTRVWILKEPRSMALSFVLSSGFTVVPTRRSWAFPKITAKALWISGTICRSASP